MATILSDVQGLVERTIYKAIRAVTEEHGYIPVITSYPNTSIGAAAYQTAIDACVVAKGFAIEVFGHSNPQAKGNKTIPRIVIKPRRVIEGGIGMNVGTVNELNAGNADFKSFTVSGTTSNIHIEVRLVSNTAAQHRILHAILMAAMNFRGYLNMYTGSGQFFYAFIGYNDEENTIEGIIENTYTYEVRDVDMMQQVIIDANVAKINEITFEIYTGSYFPNEGFTDSDFVLSDTDVIT